MQRKLWNKDFLLLLQGNAVSAVDRKFKLCKFAGKLHTRHIQLCKFLKNSFRQCFCTQFTVFSKSISSIPRRFLSFTELIFQSLQMIIRKFNFIQFASRIIEIFQNISACGTILAAQSMNYIQTGFHTL